MLRVFWFLRRHCKWSAKNLQHNDSPLPLLHGNGLEQSIHATSFTFDAPFALQLQKSRLAIKQKH
jgi:hypothetical protein